jgi:hypothetical protein
MVGRDAMTRREVAQRATGRGRLVREQSRTRSAELVVTGGLTESPQKRPSSAHARSRSAIRHARRSLEGPFALRL